MTDEREKSSRTESLARTTARDVPFTRGAGSDSEPAPRGQRPGQLPRDPTYEAELAEVGLAVLRDPERRDDPSTKQGGRRGHQGPLGQPPESVTPESPGTHAREVLLGRSPEPPSSSGRSVASGTLLSIGAVDPRGKTERTLETPRMFFSQVDAGGEAYFKPGKIPAVTVHQTLETETVKLADSVDPRRAKTLPRIDRSALARFAEAEGLPTPPGSDAPLAVSPPASSLGPGLPDESPPWNQDDYDPASSLGENDGQIHASLSLFRDQAEPSFGLDGVPTRAEPFVARRVSEPAPSLPAPDTNAIPTHRDLPAHRIEASQPPPPPVSVPLSAPGSAGPASEGTSPTTASIAAEELERRPVWLNYAAFVVALLLAVAFGLWLTNESESRPPELDAAPTAAPVLVKPLEPPSIAPSPPAPPAEAALPEEPAAAPAPKAAPPRAAPAAPLQPSAPATGTPAAAPRKPAPSKPPRETIF